MHCICRIYFLYLMTILLISYKCNSETILTLNNPSLLEEFKSKVYIIDLSKNNNKNKQFILTCSADSNALDLNLTFSGINPIYERVK